ncbi:MAG: hypothetical protein M1840_008527 [Geoglossum simile]|nr:MAG: hypothetical protein M1840_008527 [Geoglossum simile]
MWPSKKTQYSLSPEPEDDLGDDESKTGLISQKTSREKREIGIFRLHAGFALVHTVITMLWISAFWTHAPLCRRDPGLLRPSELPAAAEAIEYETVVFKISGGGTRDDPVTPYEGPPTPERDMRWYELIDVGMISLTPEMNKTLKHPTQPASKEDNTPLVQLDVFHQLHCLNSIRNIVYGTNPWYNPNDRQDQIHIGI